MVKMEDGSYLMAKGKDILTFFKQNQIVGKTITGIFPEEMDYGIGNWDEVLAEIDDISTSTNECAIETAGFVFLELNCGDWMGIQFSGSGGPVILRMTSGNRPYPKIPADLFSLNTMFHGCRGKKITKVIVDRNHEKMLFPCYCGIDMSEEDEGVWRIRLILEDGRQVAFCGSFDWSCMEYLNAKGEDETVPMAWLRHNCPEAMAAAIDEQYYEKILALLRSGVDYPVIDPIWEWPYLWSLQYTGDCPEDNGIRLQITEQLIKMGESPIVEVGGETLLDHVCYKLFNDPVDREEQQYLNRFMIRLIACGGATKYCNPQIIHAFDLENIDRYRFVLLSEPDGYHFHGEIQDEQDNVIAVI